MPQSNIYALSAIASLVGALLAAKLWVRVDRGELPGGSLWAFYLRVLVGFLMTAAVFFGFRCLQLQ
jgi:hypothetical protein